LFKRLCEERPTLSTALLEFLDPLEVEEPRALSESPAIRPQVKRIDIGHGDEKTTVISLNVS
jgi:hypothetical protein